MPDPRDAQQSPQGGGGERRVCQYRGCRNGPAGKPGIIPKSARRHRRFCDDLCRSAETRARNAEAARAAEAHALLANAEAVAPPPPPAVAELPPVRPALERFLFGLQQRRARLGLRPLVLCPALSLRATAEACRIGLQQRATEARLDQYRAEVDVAAEVLPDEAAEQASDVHAAIDARATHVGCAALSLGGGHIALAVVFATERERERAAA